ncbi:glycoside hydrolase family 17 protein [Sodiomyces alcalophilus JCM 7366]|uniref:glycoside hydrolase family 17 protein n=1 Tax=Sodiomyces alcalophilus JCM 7366 TaxID=591952 RepID=UPI0039B4A589
MSRYRNYDDPGHAEREPLDSNNYHNGSPYRSPAANSPFRDHDYDYGRQPYHQHPQQQHHQPPQQPHRYDAYPPQGYHYEQADPRPPRNVAGSHPDSSFDHIRSERQYAQNPRPGAAGGAGGVGAAAGYGVALAGPRPPAHYNHDITPGVDNFGETVSGAMPGMGPQPSSSDQGPSMPQPAYDQSPASGYYARSSRSNATPNGVDRESHSSLTPLGAAAVLPGAGTPSRSPLGNGYVPPDPYSDDPYQAYSTTRSNDPHLGVVNPNDIVDDGDDGLGYRRPQRSSLLSLSHSDRASSTTNGHGASVAAGAMAAGGIAGAVGGLAGRPGQGGYGPVHNASASAVDVSKAPADDPGGLEKSHWLAKQDKGKKRWKWVAIFTLIFIVVGAIVGGTVGGVLSQNGGGGGGGSDSSGSDGQSADEDRDENGDLGINSPEIRKLMDNDDLHKVFYGFDYTPINVQYPDCVHNPPSQNNITRDIAVLSQLTNIIRLYGTDCNQTQMVLHAIDRLELDDMKIFMGVWIDGNSTTNERQLSQMWDILDEYGEEPFEGVIVANEILFRQEMTLTELGTLLDDVRKNMTDRNIDLPVATSDLGDDWTEGLASSSDYIMSNIHPFFAHVSAEEAASWTWSFWNNHNGGIWKSDNDKNIVAEIGWPTGGGTNCPNLATSCAEGTGSEASVEGLNQLLNDWVCPAMENSTRYFWFSAFDEPWKARFDEPGREWESKWGLMDVNRNLKKGVEIPDCGGKTV